MASASASKVALITGTSSGFGLLAAVALAIEGFTVIASMRHLGKNAELLEQARLAGVQHNIHVLQMDVTNQQEIASATEHIRTQYGRLDVLINNAGYAVIGTVEDIPMADWEAQLQTNFFGAVAVTKAMLPLMRQTSDPNHQNDPSHYHGTIINISSGAGLLGTPLTGAYSASKFALEGFSESLRLELAPWNIDVVLIEPGTYSTGISRNHVYRTPADSVYAPVIATFKAFTAQAEAAHNDPSPVIHLIRRIVTARRRPTLRYRSGREVHLIAVLKRWLPWSAIERAVLALLRSGGVQ